MWSNILPVTSLPPSDHTEPVLGRSSVWSRILVLDYDKPIISFISKLLGYLEVLEYLECLLKYFIKESFLEYFKLRINICIFLIY